MIVITTKRRQREREDAAFADGANADQAEVNEFIAGKDDFIAKQSGIIVQLMDIVSSIPGAWDAYVTGDLREELRLYV